MNVISALPPELYRSWWSLQRQGEHASVECQVMELQPLTQHNQQEGYFRQGVSGHLRLLLVDTLLFLPYTSSE